VSSVTQPRTLTRTASALVALYLVTQIGAALHFASHAHGLPGQGAGVVDWGCEGQHEGGHEHPHDHDHDHDHEAPAAAAAPAFSHRDHDCAPAICHAFEHMQTRLVEAPPVGGVAPSDRTPEASCLPSILVFADRHGRYTFAPKHSPPALLVRATI
jgi:hypothetical protein